MIHQFHSCYLLKDTQRCLNMLCMQEACIQSQASHGPLSMLRVVPDYCLDMAPYQSQKINNTKQIKMPTDVKRCTFVHGSTTYVSKIWKQSK